MTDDDRDEIPNTDPPTGHCDACGDYSRLYPWQGLDLCYRCWHQSEHNRASSHHVKEE